MIKLCKECLKYYDTPEGQKSLADTILKKENLYCYHTYKKEKLLTS